MSFVAGIFNILENCCKYENYSVILMDFGSKSIREDSICKINP